MQRLSRRHWIIFIVVAVGTTAGLVKYTVTFFTPAVSEFIQTPKTVSELEAEISAREATR